MARRLSIECAERIMAGLNSVPVPGMGTPRAANPSAGAGVGKVHINPRERRGSLLPSWSNRQEHSGRGGAGKRGGGRKGARGGGGGGEGGRAWIASLGTVEMGSDRNVAENIAPRAARGDDSWSEGRWCGHRRDGNGKDEDDDEDDVEDDNEEDDDDDDDDVQGEKEEGHVGGQRLHHRRRWSTVGTTRNTMRGHTLGSSDDGGTGGATQRPTGGGSVDGVVVVATSAARSASEHDGSESGRGGARGMADGDRGADEDGEARMAPSDGSTEVGARGSAGTDGDGMGGGGGGDASAASKRPFPRRVLRKSTSMGFMPTRSSGVLSPSPSDDIASGGMRTERSSLALVSSPVRGQRGRGAALAAATAHRAKYPPRRGKSRLGEDTSWSWSWSCPGWIGGGWDCPPARNASPRQKQQQRLPVFPKSDSAWDLAEAELDAAGTFVQNPEGADKTRPGVPLDDPYNESDNVGGGDRDRMGVIASRDVGDMTRTEPAPGAIPRIALDWFIGGNDRNGRGRAVRGCDVPPDGNSDAREGRGRGSGSVSSGTTTGDISCVRIARPPEAETGSYRAGLQSVVQSGVRDPQRRNRRATLCSFLLLLSGLAAAGVAALALLRGHGRGSGVVGVGVPSNVVVGGGGGRDGVTGTETRTGTAEQGPRPSGRRRPPPAVPTDLAEVCSRSRVFPPSASNVGDKDNGGYKDCRALCERARCCYLPSGHFMSCARPYPSGTVDMNEDGELFVQGRNHDEGDGASDPCDVIVMVCSVLDERASTADYDDE